MNEVRVSSWAALNEELYRDAWDDALGRYRSHPAFRGVADLALRTTLMRLGGDYRSSRTIR